MKGVDTSALLALLEGRGEGKALLAAAGTAELATTEVNLYELSALARGKGGKRSPRESVLERLRHKITVLPLEPRGSHFAAAAAVAAPRLSPVEHLVAGIFEAFGAEEVFVSGSAPPAIPGFRAKYVVLRPKASAKRV